MGIQEARLKALAPWMAMLDTLEQRSPAPGGSTEPVDPAPVARRARAVLQALMLGIETPVPASICATERHFDANGRLRDVRPARALREIWIARDAVLRLGLRMALDPFTGAGEAVPVMQGGFDRLMAAISHSSLSQPACLQPSRAHGDAAGGYANSSAAADFFNRRLNGAIANLARLYDTRGADFAQWLLPAYVPGRSAVEHWSKAWTVAVVATYVDWLNVASGGSIARAAELVWGHATKRFRPPSRIVALAGSASAKDPRPAVLPTDADRMHFELLTQIVLAQVLDYDERRWSCLETGISRFGVELSIKALDQSDSRRWDPELGVYRNFTVYRGLTVEQLYMATAIDRLVRMCQDGSIEGLASAVTPPVQQDLAHDAEASEATWQHAAAKARSRPALDALQR